MNIEDEREVIEIRQEQTDIEKKIKELDVFLKSDKFENLPIAEQNIIYIQKQSMCLYMSLLSARLFPIITRIAKL